MPPISDEPVASVIRVLTLTGGAGDHFVGSSLPQLRKQAFGGQVLAQSLLAAASTLPQSVKDAQGYPNSIHASFLRPALTDRPLHFQVERTRDGRTMTTRRVEVSQDDKVIFTAVASFNLRKPEGLTHSAPMPQVAMPDELRDSIEIFQATGHPAAKFLGKTAAFDMRHATGSIYVRPALGDLEHHDVWVRPRTKLPQLDQSLSHALLAYVSDQIMLEPALRSLGLAWVNPRLRAATIDHSMWFHRPLDVTQWHLFHLDSPSSYSGRSLARASVYTEDGVLVASAAQEGMITLAETGAKDFWQMDDGKHHEGSSPA